MISLKEMLPILLFSIEPSDISDRFYLDDEVIARFNPPSQGYWKFGNLQGPNPWPTRDAPFDKHVRIYIAFHS